MLPALPILAAATVIALLAIAAWGLLQVRLQTVVRHRAPVRRVAVPLLLLGLLLPTVAQASPAPVPLRWRSSAVASGEGEISSGRASRERAPFGENRTSGFRLFLQVDPNGYQDSPNLYAGFGNDPVNNRDPTGRNYVPTPPTLRGVACGLANMGARIGGFLDWLRPGGDDWETMRGNVEAHLASCEPGGELGIEVAVLLLSEGGSRGATFKTGRGSGRVPAGKGDVVRVRPGEAPVRFEGPQELAPPPTPREPPAVDPASTRVKLRTATRQAIEAKQPRNDAGEMIDPYTQKVLKPEEIDVGHKRGQEWRTRQKMHRERGSTREEVIEMENDPDLYHLQDRVENRSHRFEEK